MRLLNSLPPCFCQKMRGSHTIRPLSSDPDCRKRERVACVVFSAGNESLSKVNGPRCQPNGPVKRQAAISEEHQDQYRPA